MERSPGLASLQSISSSGLGGSLIQTKLHGEIRRNPRDSNGGTDFQEIENGDPRPTGWSTKLNLFHCSSQ